MSEQEEHYYRYLYESYNDYDRRAALVSIKKTFYLIGPILGVKLHFYAIGSFFFAEKKHIIENTEDKSF